MTEYAVICLVLLSLALLISLGLNVIFCIRQAATLCRDTEECCFTNISGESPSQNEGHYFDSLNHDEQQESPHDHHEQQENPIYGNISSDRRDSVELCYETMTMNTRDPRKSLEPDLNYASLDLKIARKRLKKNRHAKGRNKLQEDLPVHLTPPTNAFMEAEADMDAYLPPRDSSAMVSHSSIYLNSQQIAQETEEMEREKGMNAERKNRGWEGIRTREEGRSGEWNREQDTEKRIHSQDGSNGSVFTQLLELEAIQDDSDHFLSSFSDEHDQQD
ncbi:uncharacterized protein LOC117955718 [Etheostoma cragini]|uniref:uncharacterized protein LOC117955718 n=1 Tax=Etheostoma cragini TaxID=417921 RepID=UPI00155EF570|nr:uncharacterized protein LOC117955718 [Etheostoma cragini]